MTEHTIICTRDTLQTVLENIDQCGAVEIEAKQMDSVKYLITYKVEVTQDDE